MSKVKLRVVLNNAEDQFHWSNVIESYFKFNGLWDLVSGERKLEEAASDEEKKQFEKDQYRVLLEIQQVVGKKYSPGIWEFKTPHEVYQHLKKQCLGDVFLANERIRGEIEKVRWLSVEDLVTTFRTKLNEYKNFGGVVEDHEFLRLLLAQLPEKYNSLKMKLVREAANRHGKRNLEKILKDVESAANVLGEWKKKKIQAVKVFNSVTRKKLKCYNCNKIGYLAKDCRNATFCYKCKETGHIAIN